MVINSNSLDIEKYIDMLIDAGIDKYDARIEVMDFFDADKSRIDEFVRRRISGEPAAYIIGKKPFYKSEFYVGKGVLIPRSDTEILVEAALKYLHVLDFPMGDVLKVPDSNIIQDGTTIKFADFCTGSGCIGISIQKELSDKGMDSEGTLIDISEDALICSRKNSSMVNNIDVMKMDVLNKDEVLQSFSSNSLDLIVSNPPYIDACDMQKLDSVVKDYEPELALFGGEDGLLFYNVIVDEAYNLLKEGGALMVEHGYNQAEAISAMFMEKGFRNIVTLKDYGMNDRVTIGVK